MLQSHGDDESEIPRAPGDTNAEASDVCSFIASACLCSDGMAGFTSKETKNWATKRSRGGQTHEQKKEEEIGNLGCKNSQHCTLFTSLTACCACLFLCAHLRSSWHKKKRVKKCGLKSWNSSRLSIVNCFCATSQGPDSWLI